MATMATAATPISELILRRTMERSGLIEAPPRPMPDAVQWIQENFYLYDTGELMTLHECQIRPLELALKRDTAGNYCYSTVLWSWPKKSAKTTLIAAVVDYIADNRPRSQIKLIANDLKQADSRVGMYIRESIAIAKSKGKRLGIRVTPSGYKIDYPNGSRIEMIPIDPTGEAGGNDDLIVYSELWGWKSSAHQRMWSEMTLSPTKFGNSQRWIDTYAGIEGESPVLAQMYETAVKQGRQLWDDHEVYVNDAAKTLAVWVTKPMFPWQTEAYYAEQTQTLTPSEFRRMHRNEWVTSEDAFIPIELWDACKVDTLPPMEELDTGHPYSIHNPSKRSLYLVAGVDAAVSGDCFAVVAVSKHALRGADGFLTNEYKYAVRYVRKWTPTPGHKLSFAEPEAEIVRLGKDERCVCFAYDPYQLHDMSTRLRNQSVWMHEFPQGKERLIADKQLYDMILRGDIIHDGNPDLREHMLNANAKTEGDKLRIVKRNEHLKIDLVVALSMAIDRAKHLGIS